VKASSEQKDTDQDLIGDFCDTDADRDSDGVQDDWDNCEEVANSDQADIDGDGIGEPQ
jgi:syndecan 4